MSYNNKFIIIIAGFAIIWFLGVQASADPKKINEAREFIARFETLSHNYDKNLGDLYSDKALIIRHLENKKGELKEKIVIPTHKYKKLLKLVRYFARIQKYKNYYKDLEYKPEGKNIRVNGIRENNSGYTSPVSILVGENDNGQWKIMEEITNTTSEFLVKRLILKI